MATDVYHLHTWLWLPAPRSRVFAFFADAHNLERITPPFLRFRVLNASPIEMHPGARIDYQLRLHHLPVRWSSEITVWQPPSRFCDTQLRGPYREWIHTHTFEDDDNGTMVRDDVRYRLPGPSLVARLANRFMVAPDTRAIFEHRHRVLREVFDARDTARVGPVAIERSDL